MQFFVFCCGGPVYLGCLFAVPVTHTYGLYRHCPSSARLKHFLLYPFTGGKRHMVFQLLAWTIWFLSSLAIIPVVVSNQIQGGFIDTLSGPALVAAVVGELFMIKSLMVFDPSQQHQELRSQKPVQLVFSNPLIASYTVMVMGCVLSLLGGAMLFIVEHLPDSTSRSAYIVAAMICVLISSTSTHGLGGFLRHAKTRRGWRFYQPFHGGTLFVATQFTGWMLFSLSFVGLMRILLFLMSGVAYCIRCWSAVIFVMMLGSQAFLALSLLTYKQKKSLFTTIRIKSSFLQQFQFQKINFRAIWPVIILFIPYHLVLIIVIALYCTVPTKIANFIFLISFVPYYIITRQGSPEHHGNKRWKYFCDLCTRDLPFALMEWMGGVHVVRCTPLNPHDRHIFCYHPHGLFPAGAAYLTLLPQFQNLFPGITPVTLTASVMHYVPLVKEMCCWTGSRIVTRSTFVKALREEGSVLISPGGQEELVEWYRATHSSQQQFSQLLQQSQNLLKQRCEAQNQQLNKIKQSFLDKQQKDSMTFQISEVFYCEKEFKELVKLHQVQDGNQTEEEEDEVEGQGQGQEQENQQQYNSRNFDDSVTLQNQQQQDSKKLNGDVDSLDDTDIQNEVLQNGKLINLQIKQEDLQSLQPLEKNSKDFEFAKNQGQHTSQMVLCKRHKGFIRLSIEEQAKLVPVLPLGEIFQMRNFVNWPWLQNATYKILGFPVPYFIVGRWKIAPFPRKVPMVFLVGDPITPPTIPEGEEVPQSLVLEFHNQYYEKVRELFDKHKDLHPLYRNTELIFKGRN